MISEVIHTWRRKDGTFIALSDMTDSHLENAIAMMRRRIADLNTKVRWATDAETNLIREKNRRQDALTDRRREEKRAREKSFIPPQVSVGRMFREDA